MNHLKDFDKIEEVLKNRHIESISPLFTSEIENADILIATASSDLGVCRNGGRRGASFAPQAILSILKKMANHNSNKRIAINEVALKKHEEINFPDAQLRSAEKLIETYKKFSGDTILHLGGGHDHAFPLLKSLEYFNKEIKIINIDAHMDTRNDAHPHSGTPFRQYAEEAKAPYHLIEFGIHHYANTESTIKPIPNGKMTIFDDRQIRYETNNYQYNFENWLNTFIPIKKDEIVFLSLDADAISSDVMEGVSAVNHDGIPLFIIKQIFDYVRSNCDLFVSGIYEYNPIYDNLGQKGARALSALIYENILF